MGDRFLQEQRRELLQTIEKAETEIRDFAGPAPLDAIDLSCFTADGAIGLKRLQAVPWASHCIQCQEQAEVVKMGGAVNLRIPLPDSARASGT